MKYEYQPYPPFDFNFYLDTDVSFTQSYLKPEEDQSPIAVTNRELFKHTPYLRGSCNICGESTVFFCKNLIHPRDYLVCMHCGSTSRYRSIARGLIDAIQSITSKKISSLSELKGMDLGKRIAIYDTQMSFSLGVVTYPIPFYLSLCESIELYLSDVSYSGASVGVNGELISKQNLERLTFASGQFDIVITSDVMEHVRLPHRAHQEIARVMKKNAFYVFTVPHFRHTYDTMRLVVVQDERDASKDKFVGEPVYHGDPNSAGAALVYQVFGLDIDDQLKEYALDVSYFDSNIPESGIIGTELFYCKKH